MFGPGKGNGNGSCNGNAYYRTEQCNGNSVSGSVLASKYRKQPLHTSNKQLVASQPVEKAKAIFIGLKCNPVPETQSICSD